MANQVNWFEIPTQDLNRAKKFYEDVFELELSLQEMGPMKMAWFPSEEKGAGATGTLVHYAGYQPSPQGVTIYFNVGSIEDTLKKVESKGGKTVSGKQPIGPYGFAANFTDSEGNRVGLHEPA